MLVILTAVIHQETSDPGLLKRLRRILDNKAGTASIRDFFKPYFNLTSY